jgi:hypothetical protein
VFLELGVKRRTADAEQARGRGAVAAGCSSARCRARYRASAARQHAQRVGAEPQRAALVLLCCLLQEVHGQLRDIVASGAQRWQPERHHIQA